MELCCATLDRVGSCRSVGEERTRARRTQHSHTWLDLPRTPSPTPSGRLSPYLPLYLYTCHGRASCTDVEIHASLNNPGPTLIRIFTRRNNIRPAVPRDILRKDPSDTLSFFLSRASTILPLSLSLSLSIPLTSGWFLVSENSFSLFRPRHFSRSSCSSSPRLFLSFLSSSDLLLHTRTASAYHANARDHVLFMR